MANLEELRALDRAINALPKERQVKKDIKEVRFSVRLMIENIEDGVPTEAPEYVSAAASLLEKAKKLIYSIN